MKLTKMIQLMKKDKISYQFVANELGVSKPFIWQIANGKRRLSYERAISISAVFNMKPDELFYSEFIKKIKK